jgi:hypothetical protein
MLLELPTRVLHYDVAYTDLERVRGARHSVASK